MLRASQDAAGRRSHRRSPVLAGGGALGERIRAMRRFGFDFGAGGAPPIAGDGGSDEGGAATGVSTVRSLQSGGADTGAPIKALSSRTIRSRA